jgi:hypothetical protein
MVTLYSQGAVLKTGGFPPQICRIRTSRTAMAPWDVLSAVSALATLALATPPPALERRSLSDILGNIENGIDIKNLTQGIIPSFFDSLPGVDKIKNQLNLTDGDIDELPLEVLNIP